MNQNWIYCIVFVVLVVVADSYSIRKITKSQRFVIISYYRIDDTLMSNFVTSPNSFIFFLYDKSFIFLIHFLCFDILSKINFIRLNKACWWSLLFRYEKKIFYGKYEIINLQFATLLFFLTMFPVFQAKYFFYKFIRVSSVLISLIFIPWNERLSFILLKNNYLVVRLLNSEFIYKKYTLD